ncbi:MAG: acyltransferase family protein, partial [Planktomarina sp.]
SLWTILPVLGTLLVLLFGGAGSLSDRILNLAPLRWIGLISYSAYLWHQPAFSIAKNGSWFTGSPWQSVVLIGITMILATASWRWIEQPFRQQRLGKFWGGTVLVFAALAIFCFAILTHTSKGIPSRLPAQVAEIAAFAESYHPNYRRCLFTRSEVGERDIAQSCQYGDQEPSVAIWGDSHAAALAGPLGDMLALRGVGAIQLTLSSCLPVPGLINNTQSRAERCPEFNAQAVEYLLNSEAINTVVLHASWVSYFKNRSLKTMNGVEEFDHFFAYPTGGQPDMNVQDRRDVVGAVFGDLIFKLQAAGKRVIIVRTAPRPGVRVPELAARSVWREGTIASTPQFAMAYERFNRANPDMLFAELVRNPDINTANLHIMDPHDVFCGSTHCLTHNGEVPYYADGNHLSVPGANQLADHVLRNVID